MDGRHKKKECGVSGPHQSHDAMNGWGEPNVKGIQNRKKKGRGKRNRVKPREVVERKGRNQRKLRITKARCGKRRRKNKQPGKYSWREQGMSAS